MNIAHLSREISALGVSTPAAHSVTELVQAQSNVGDEVLVISRVSLEGFTPPPYLARRLSPLVFASGGVTGEALVMEGLLPGSHARLFVFGFTAGSEDTLSFGRAVQALIPTLTFVPELVHLHGDTGAHLDGLRELLDGVALVQSVYDANTDSPALVTAIGDADAVVVPTSGLWEATPDRAVAQSLAAYPQVRVVLGGLDLTRWNPAKDSTLEATFSPEALAGKATCRLALQRRAGLPPRQEPLLVCLWPRRITDADLQPLLDLQEDLLRLDAQFVAIPPESGLSEAHLWDTFCQHTRCFVAPDASEATQRGMLAGADVVWLPEATAPLGRRALIAMRYGVVPLARPAQAHRDILVEYDESSLSGGALLFESGEELLRALSRLEKIHQNGDAWLSMVRANALLDSGWARPLAHFTEIYRKALVR